MLRRFMKIAVVPGDGIGVDTDAGKGFDDSVNVIRDCEVSGASDKGIKVTTGAHVRVERSWVHDNVNGGIRRRWAAICRCGTTSSSATVAARHRMACP